MSVHQESIRGHASAGNSAEKAPELEYSAVGHETLSMIGAAVGGAILGMLLTLLILAILNGGTLRFGVSDNGETLTNIQEFAEAVNRNVDANSQNIAKLNEEFGTVATSLSTEVAKQNLNITEMNETMSTLDVTRQQFGTFIQAMSEAMNSIQGVTSSDEAAAPAVSVEEATVVEAAPAIEDTVDSAPIAVSSPDVAPGSIEITMFADANGNGEMDTGEAFQNGLNVLLMQDGEKVDTIESADEAITFVELGAGAYSLEVTDVDGNMLLSGIEIDMLEDAEEGQMVRIAVTQE